MDEPLRPLVDVYWVVPGILLAGEAPSGRDEAAIREKLDWLRDEGATFFIDLREEGSMSYEHLLPEDLPYRRMGIPDFGTPAPEAMKKILDTIDSSIAGGHTVYIHCAAGRGRTGTVVGCWLARHGRAGEAALAELMRLREAALSRHERSPETDEQREMVRRWREGE